MIQFILFVMIIQYIPNRPLIMDIMAWGGLLISIINFGIKLGKSDK